MREQLNGPSFASAPSTLSASYPPMLPTPAMRTPLSSRDVAGSTHVCVLHIPPLVLRICPHIFLHIKSRRFATVPASLPAYFLFFALSSSISSILRILYSHMVSRSFFVFPL
jgi:hypothetical protein